MLAALTHSNHWLVVDLTASKFIGIRSFAAYLQRQLLWVVPFLFDVAGVLAALTHSNHWLVVDLTANKFIGIRSFAAYLQRQLLWV
ncbi:hypothetical protein EGX47_06325 [Yersinia pseudotuberculosis]|uniref:Uncharacterized protein n=2 Tax=Yersinia pseudotuberculosis TaxID=633 RepID=A0ABM7AFG1_YERPU|nr:hypothetical protein EGX47_06325 [Yersinia pseudotuberculosis]